MSDYDVVIVGGGLAGLTAGLFAARHGHATLVLVAGVPGGHLVSIDRIEDFPGFPGGVAGYELCPAVEEQAASAGAEFDAADVLGLAAEPPDWRITTASGEHRARAVIIASGTRPRTLGVPGEERLAGRGVSHCASCDGPLHRGQVVGVVGGGDSALQEALTLAEHAGSVLIFHRGAALTGQSTYQQRVHAHPRIQVRASTVVAEILGEAAVTGVRTRHTATGAEDEVALAGLFVYIGLAPNTEWLRGVLPLDADGRIATDAWLGTPLPGVFAAGDVRRDAAGQAITAAGDGATAAIAAHRYLAQR